MAEKAVKRRKRGIPHGGASVPASRALGQAKAHLKHRSINPSIHAPLGALVVAIRYGTIYAGNISPKNDRQ